MALDSRHPPHSMWTSIATEAMAQASWEVSDRQRCRRRRPEAIPVAICGFQSIRFGKQSVVHDIEELMAMARRKLNPEPY